MSVIPCDFTKYLSLTSNIFESLKAFTLSQQTIYPYNLSSQTTATTTGIKTIQDSRWTNLYSSIPIQPAITWNSSSLTSQIQTPPTSSSTSQRTSWTTQIQPPIQQKISFQNLMTYCCSNTTRTTPERQSPTSSNHYQEKTINTMLKEMRIPDILHLKTILTTPKKSYKIKL